MAISLAQQLTYRCASCSATNTTLAWTVIDCVERPDLREVLTSPAWLATRCRSCGSVANRDAPMLSLRLDPIVPLVLGLPDDAFLEGDPSARAKALLDRTEEAVLAQGQEIPGPVLPAPFDVLSLAAARDVSRDVASPAAALAEVAHEDGNLAGRYEVFLREAAGSHRERRIGQGLTAVMSSFGADQLRQSFADFPELALPEAHARLKAWADSTDDPREEQLTARSQLALLEGGLTGDFEAAWAAHEEALREMWVDHLGPRIENLIRRFDDAAGTNWPAAAAAAEELLAVGESTGMADVQLAGTMRVVTALHEMDGPGRTERLERVIVLLERALAMMEETPELEPADGRADVQLRLGAALAARGQGDPLANQLRAVDAARRVLELVDLDSAGPLWATAHTNLGLSLLEALSLRPAEVLAAEGLDEDEAFAEAIEHFNQALRWRSMERDALDFAFTQINLGLAWARRGGPDWPSFCTQALAHYAEALRGFEAAGRSDLAAQALHNAAGARRRLAAQDGFSDTEADALLSRAEADVRAALAARPASVSPEGAGRSLTLLGRILEQQGRREEASNAYTGALEVLPPGAYGERRETAGQLAAMAETDGDWAAAARAREEGALAAASTSAERALSEGRFDELHENLNMSRWAAYALARAGRPERAVEVLEHGRAREIAGWLSNDLLDLRQLRHLNPELADRYADIRRQVQEAERQIRRGEPVQVAEIAPVAEALTQAIDEIRRLPGMERFGLAARIDEIFEAARDDEAIVYPVTSPHGTVLLIVSCGPPPAVEIVSLPDLSSTDVLGRLLFANEVTGRVSGYLVAQAEAEDDELDAAIRDVGALLGEHMLRPLAQVLERLGVRAVCIVPVGLLALLPLHAIGWDEGGKERCLLDHFEVTVAPSALAQRVCRERADRRSGPVEGLLVVGNPLPHPCPLDGAESEARMVAATVPAHTTTVLLGEDATKARVLQGLVGAGHVHLACHGRAATGARDLNAHLELAQAETLTGAELLELDGFRPRLVVASACETGIIAGYEEADESLALSTTFIGAGAAGVIASLWAVNDYATTLLMSRFYESIAAGRKPGSALREAQLWLRDLTTSDEDSYLRDRPILRAHRDEHARRKGSRGDRTGETQRWSAPSMWAPFVLVGA